MDQDTAADTIERLLTAIQRLRGERDDLRRDMEFLTVEQQFTVQSLEQKLATATSAPVTPAFSTFNTSDLVALEGHVQGFQDQAERATRAALAMAIVTQCVGSAHDRQVSRTEALQADLHTLEQQVRRLRDATEQLEGALAAERKDHAETGSALADLETRLDSVSEALCEAENARDALALEKSHLESDLMGVREELEDAEARHAEQLAAVSAAGQSGHGAYAALRTQIRELEERVLRRTEQIGVHQHDIKRLELNMKLQEERIAEMTQDLEVYQNEKTAMLEDCKTSREERDDARQRCEQLEDAMEIVDEERARELEAMVGVTVDAFASRRAFYLQSELMSVTSKKERTQLEERICLLEKEKVGLTSQVETLTTAHDLLAQTTEADLSSVRMQLEHMTSTSQLADSQLIALRNELESKEQELASLKRQLAATQASYDRDSLNASVSAEEKAALESSLNDLQAARLELQSRLADAVNKVEHVQHDLERTEDELERALANGNTHAAAEEALRAEIGEVNERHAREVASLEGQIKHISEELETTVQARLESASTLDALREELSQTKTQLEARVAQAGESLESTSKIEAELEQLKNSHADEVRSLRDERDAIAARLQDVTDRKDELEALHGQVTKECEELTEQMSETVQRIQALEASLADLHTSHREELRDIQVRLENSEQALAAAKVAVDSQQCETIDTLNGQLEELQGRLIAMTKEADEYRMEVDDEKAAHARTREVTSAELENIAAKRDEAEAALAKAEQQIPELRGQLEHLESMLHEAEEEKLGLQYQTTNLEAEIQRAKSLQRHLESQAADGYATSTIRS